VACACCCEECETILPETYLPCDWCGTPHFPDGVCDVICYQISIVEGTDCSDPDCNPTIPPGSPGCPGAVPCPNPDYAGADCCGSPIDCTEYECIWISVQDPPGSGLWGWELLAHCQKDGVPSGEASCDCAYPADAPPEFPGVETTTVCSAL